MRDRSVYWETNLVNHLRICLQKIIKHYILWIHMWFYFKRLFFYESLYSIWDFKKLWTWSCVKTICLIQVKLHLNKVEFSRSNPCWKLSVYFARVSMNLTWVLSFPWVLHSTSQHLYTENSRRNRRAQSSLLSGGPISRCNWITLYNNRTLWIIR